MKNLYTIISDEKENISHIINAGITAAVIIFLYYDEQVHEYNWYIQNIPEGIDIYIISPKESILQEFRSSRYIKVKKENRGRDISALLVCAEPFIFKYDYVCFIHDKKEKCCNDEDYIKLWKRNLWSNMLESKHYITNILESFQNDKALGMYVPLPPHKGDKGAWINGTWGKNYSNTHKLADLLNLHVNISEDEPPIALSTVFWARTCALKKLYGIKWKYKDFPDEPIRDDGEINHAIERIFQYVVQDAGYEVKVAISSSFAAEFFQQLQGELSYLWTSLNDNLGIRDYSDIKNYKERLEKIRDFKRINNQIYIYGAGRRCQDCLKICKVLNINPQGIVVSDGNGNIENVEGIPVITVEKFEQSPSRGIIVAVVEKYQEEIIATLEKNKINNYILF